MKSFNMHLFALLCLFLSVCPSLCWQWLKNHWTDFHEIWTWVVVFEVLTAVVMKSSIFWDTTLCRLLCLLTASCWFIVWFILWPWRWRQHVPLKHCLTFNGLNGIISQKTELSKFGSFTKFFNTYQIWLKSENNDGHFTCVSASILYVKS
jgi:hypothetical protein